MLLLYGSFVFWDTFFGIQECFGPMVWIGAWCICFNWCSGLYFDNFLAVFVCFTCFPFEFLDIMWNIWGNVCLFLPILRSIFWNWQLCTQQSYATKNIFRKLGILPVFDNITVQELINELRWRGWIRSERPSKKHIARVCKYHSRITFS